MSPGLAVGLNVVFMVAILATLAYVMASPRKLTPHRPTGPDAKVRPRGRDARDPSHSDNSSPVIQGPPRRTPAFTAAQGHAPRRPRPAPFGADGGALAGSPTT
jgi:hypothetical protein